MTDAMKTCTKCKAVKPLSAFGVDRSRRDGLKYLCRDCCSPARRIRMQKPGAREAAREAYRKRRERPGVREADQAVVRKRRGTKPRPMIATCALDTCGKSFEPRRGGGELQKFCSKSCKEDAEREDYHKRMQDPAAREGMREYNRERTRAKQRAQAPRICVLDGCGKPVPLQEGKGRYAKYCSATCRTEGRREYGRKHEPERVASIRERWQDPASDPHSDSTSKKVCGLKSRDGCQRELPCVAFGINRSNADGLNNICKSCETAKSQKRKALKLRAMPKGLRTPEIDAQIRAIYNSAPDGSDIDHGIPLKAPEWLDADGNTVPDKYTDTLRIVQGLHVPWNLAPLEASVNGAKYNRFKPITIFLPDDVPPGVDRIALAAQIVDDRIAQWNDETRQRLADDEGATE